MDFDRVRARRREENKIIDLEVSLERLVRLSREIFRCALVFALTKLIDMQIEASLMQINGKAFLPVRIPRRQSKLFVSVAPAIELFAYLL